VFTGIASQAKFGVFNDKGEQIYYAFEGKFFWKYNVLFE